MEKKIQRNYCIGRIYKNKICELAKKEQQLLP